MQMMQQAAVCVGGATWRYPGACSMVGSDREGMAMVVVCIERGPLMMMKEEEAAVAACKEYVVET
jgi:hypothetical protein